MNFLEIFKDDANEGSSCESNGGESGSNDNHNVCSGDLVTEVGVCCI